MPSGVNPARPIVPRPPASETAAASADRPTAAIPAEIIGYSMPNISEILVCSMTDRLPCLPPGIYFLKLGLVIEHHPLETRRWAMEELSSILLTHALQTHQRHFLQNPTGSWVRCPSFIP